LSSVYLLSGLSVNEGRVLYYLIAEALKKVVKQEQSVILCHKNVIAGMVVHGYEVWKYRLSDPRLWRDGKASRCLGKIEYGARL
jgi:hypothetical protein